MNALRIACLALLAAACGNRQLVGVDQEIACGGSSGVICPDPQRCAPDPTASCPSGKDCPGFCKMACVQNVACTTQAHWDPTTCACVVDTAGDLGTAQCNVVADCPVNTGASCATTCPDGSNPCVNACTNHQCVQRGCPAATDGGSCQPLAGPCTVNSDCCSDNCITRVSPGYCCVPGGCP